MTARPYDRSVGYVPTYERCRSRLPRSIHANCAGHGLGAGMALRCDIALQFGGFDEAFGPGARFPSADDLDMCIRVLLSGRHVYETAGLTILHHRFRTLAQGREHARRDWIGSLIRGSYKACAPLWIARRCCLRGGDPRQLFPAVRPSYFPVKN